MRLVNRGRSNVSEKLATIKQRRGIPVLKAAFFLNHSAKFQPFKIPVGYYLVLEFINLFYVAVRVLWTAR